MKDTPYNRMKIRWYIKGLECALGFAPETETDGGACSEDIREEINRIKKEWGIK